MTTIFPTLKYDDAHAAIEFLCSAVGMERHQVYESDAGKVAHAELRFADAVVMLGSRGEGDPRFEPGSPAVVYVATDEVDARHDRAKAAGAEILMSPTDQDYGSRDFALADPEGNVWAFGTYAPTAEG
jgi:uncharacterized glyoxalase superfamily protein PhnB